MNNIEEVMKKIYDYSLEEIMGDRFGKYSKTIIQDRALPDVRDGLKPVQRRILYAMYRDKNTYDKPHRKCAKTVGNVLGFYHPHGDTSVYEAMVRMSQWWKQNTPYIDMHGNNGSMDGDSAAAMRYTEARLSKISEELLKDIDKDTIMWAPNYDDSCLEPTVLPSKFPALLVNGSTGISAGYATNIPPHNLGEIIDATIKRIDSPNCHLDSILDIVKGPDFPTGCIVEGKNGIIEAYKTGKGKVIIRSKCEFIKNKGKDQILITEIPFEVNKAALVKKIEDIRLDKKIDGILEVRDESDREDPMRIVIDLKKDIDKDLVLNYLYKNTELQVTFAFNMVAIVNRRPMTIGILEILDAYIKHQIEVITKRSQFDLDHFSREAHITEGLIKALSILDEVIATIRASKNKTDAKDNLILKFQFTEIQAEAIVTLQLYRLTNTDVTELMMKAEQLKIIIAGLKEILEDPEKLKSVLKEELRKIKKEYAVPRKTEIKDELTEIKIDTTLMIPKEDCLVVVTKDGYVKRVSNRSYTASINEEVALKEGDYVIGMYNMNTLDTLLMFTDLGNYLYVPVYEIPDLKWKELGKHISNIITIQAGEEIINSMPVYSFDDNTYITTFTKLGMIKRTKLSEYKVQRYSKPITNIKLKDNDRVIDITSNNDDNVFITTNGGYGLWYGIEEVPITGLKASGVKAILLKNDYVVSGHIFNMNNEYLTVITQKGTAKRVRITEFEKGSRARRGLLLIRDVKTNPYKIIKTFIITNKDNLEIRTKNEAVIEKITNFPISDRYSTGSAIVKEEILKAFILIKEPVIITEDNNEKKESDVSLSEIDKKIMTIDDFLNDFEV